jgi:hypothetical protein
MFLDVGDGPSVHGVCGVYRNTLPVSINWSWFRQGSNVGQALGELAWTSFCGDSNGLGPVDDGALSALSTHR